jgi:hypothetical protein
MCPEHSTVRCYPDVFLSPHWINILMLCWRHCISASLQQTSRVGLANGHPSTVRNCLALSMLNADCLLDAAVHNKTVTVFRPQRDSCSDSHVSLFASCKMPDKWLLYFRVLRLCGCLSGLWHLQTEGKHCSNHMLPDYLKVPGFGRLPSGKSSM